MSEFGCASTSPFKISSVDLSMSQKRTQPFAQRQKEDVSERAGEYDISPSDPASHNSQTPSAPSVYPDSIYDPPSISTNAMVLSPMQKPFHRFSAAPHEPRIVDVQLVITTSNREQQSVGTEADSLHFAFRQMGLRARGAQRDLERVQLDLLHGTLPVLLADVVQPHGMRPVASSGA